ncbi:DUF6888 family protein [Iningainema tapete]
MLLRLGERTGNVFIISGEELEIELRRDGRWSFIT